MMSGRLKINYVSDGLFIAFVFSLLFLVIKHLAKRVLKKRNLYFD
jgi:hypothetical protein